MEEQYLPLQPFYFNTFIQSIDDAKILVPQSISSLISFLQQTPNLIYKSIMAWFNTPVYSFEFHVRWDPCPHSMARPRVADGGTASRYGG
jgi:hypothetical protein